MENWDPSKGVALVILFGGRPPWRLGDTIRNLVPRHLRISRSLVRGTHPYPYIAPSPDVSGKYHAYLFLGKHITGDKQGGQIWYRKYVWRRRFWGSHSKTQHSNIYLCLEFAEVCQKFREFMTNRTYQPLYFWMHVFFVLYSCGWSNGPNRCH